MSILSEQVGSDSPYVESIARGWTASAGSTIRPAESHWHMVVTRFNGSTLPLIVGPWASAGVVSYGAGAEILWIQFKLGTYMPHLPTRRFRDSETLLPQAARRSFWLDGSAWQFPDDNNVDTFISRLVRADVLRFDPVVSAALQGCPPELSARTVRHRFLHATGLTQGHIHQIERARRAADLLRQGGSILDTVEEAGYFDQPHLTRSLKQWVGYTPAQIIRLSRPDCHSVQDSDPAPSYDTDVLEKL